MTRRNILLLLLSLFVGPGIGGVVFLLLAGFVDAIVGESGTAFMGSFWPIVLFAAYVLGAVPGLLSGIAMIVLSNVVPNRFGRLATATLVGAVISPACIATILFADMSRAANSSTMLIVIAIVGAVSALACNSIVEARHPLPVATA